jgi:hypothetical protein
MKAKILIGVLSIVAVLSACDKAERTNQLASAVVSPNVDLKVVNWGPQFAKAGTNPNLQPDGSVGLWVEVAGGQGLGEAQVIFAGKPAKLTTVQDKLITAAVDPLQLSQVGEREVFIKQSGTGKLFPVGVFKITAQ